MPTFFPQEERQDYEGRLYKLSSTDFLLLLDKIHKVFEETPEVAHNNRFYIFVLENKEKLWAEKVELEDVRNSKELDRQNEAKMVRVASRKEREAGILPTMLSPTFLNTSDFIEKVLEFFHPDHRERLRRSLQNHIQGSAVKIRDAKLSFARFYSMVAFEYQGVQEDQEVYLGSGLFEKFLNGDLSVRDLHREEENFFESHEGRKNSEKPNLDQIERNIK
jgi:hypothetical protein